MNLINCILVGIGGFLGSVLRYLLSFLPFKPSNGFPVNTFITNIAGAFIIGCIIAIFEKHTSLDARLLLVFKVGFCGGFTTFSTFSSETMGLIGRGAWGLAALYAVLSVSLCVGAVFCGQYVFR